MIRRSGIFDGGRMKRFRSANAAGLVECNYWGSGTDGSLTVSADTTWDSGSSGEMIVRNFVDFTVNSGVTLTIKARKGCLIYVRGNCEILGTILVQSGYPCDPVAAGVNSAGIAIVRRKSGAGDSGASDFSGCGSDAVNAEANQPPISGNGKRYSIPRFGAAGGAARQLGANAGNNGSGLQTGGGGSGGGGYYGGYSGAGGAGTCFSGGAGGGGSYGSGSNGAAGSSIGGAGGAAGDAGAGGAGNPGGGCTAYGSYGGNGIGGLLILLVKGDMTVAAGARIMADGAAGGAVGGSSLPGGGGGSGGGAILCLHAGVLTNNGVVRASGGAGGGGSSSYPGGAGGAGGVLIETITK